RVPRGREGAGPHHEAHAVAHPRAQRQRRHASGSVMDPADFRAALLAVAPAARDAWLDRVLGLDAPPADAPLPQGCVPYLPCGVDAPLEVVARAQTGAGDVFVDVGAGVGRAAAFVHRYTGAAAIGIELQAALVDAARGLPIAMVHGDAAEALPAAG